MGEYVDDEKEELKPMGLAGVEDRKLSRAGGSGRLKGCHVF